MSARTFVDQQKSLGTRNSVRANCSNFSSDREASMQSSQAWRDLAIGEYLQNLPADEERQFRQAFVTEIAFEQVIAVLRSQDNHVRSKRYTRILQRLEKTSRPLQRLSDAVDVIAQARSEICLIWGPLRATIMVRGHRLNSSACLFSRLLGHQSPCGSP